MREGNVALTTEAVWDMCMQANRYLAEAVAHAITIAAPKEEVPAAKGVFRQHFR